MNFSWEDESSHLFINPSYSFSEQEKFKKILTENDSLKGHIWLSTSGSSSQKWAGLSKQAILESAKAVNTHLDSDIHDCWIQALPFFHVGGLSIHARAFLSGAKVEIFRNDCKGKWDVSAFYDFLIEKKGSLISLVPTQLFDLVALGYKAPSSVRALIIGGGNLIPELYKKAVELDWPIMPTYGMTEFCSQIASAPLSSIKNRVYPVLELLPHLEVKEEGGCLAFKGSSLFTTYANFEKNTVTFCDPKKEGWFLTEDRGTCQQGVISLFGRRDSLVKIGGENVDLSYLESLLEILCLELNIPCELALIAENDSRLGSIITLIIAESISSYDQKILSNFNRQVLPFERIRKVNYREKIPRSSLGKILKKRLHS